MIHEAGGKPHLGGPDAPVVVVAGGTGTGKTTLVEWLAERGALRIDADRIGHEQLLEPEVVAAIRARFGEEVLDEEEQIDRRALGERVFADPQELEFLDRLVHPRIVAEIERRIEVFRRSRACPMVVIDAALWWQFEPRPPVDLVLMATAPEEVRRQRIMARDGLDEAAAQRRIERQRTVEASLARADAVLDTARDRDALRRELFALIDEHCGTRWRESDPTGTATD